MLGARLCPPPWKKEGGSIHQIGAGATLTPKMWILAAVITRGSSAF